MQLPPKQDRIKGTRWPIRFRTSVRARLPDINRPFQPTLPSSAVRGMRAFSPSQNMHRPSLQAVGILISNPGYKGQLYEGIYNAIKPPMRELWEGTGGRARQVPWVSHSRNEASMRT